MEEYNAETDKLLDFSKNTASFIVQKWAMPITKRINARKLPRS